MAEGDGRVREGAGEMKGVLRKLFGNFAGLLARLVERSALVRRAMRVVRVPGRRLVVDQLRADALPQDITRAEVRGMTFDLSLRDDVQRSIYFEVYEPEDVTLVADLVGPGDICLDVGANVGFYALQMARCVGNTGTVHAFEADARVAAMLEKNRDLNGAARVLRIHRKAVSSADGEAVFYSSATERSGWGSLVKFDDIAAKEVRVPTIKLDSFLDAEGIRKVAFMKMDIEANEPEALAGATQALRDRRFAHILIEFNGVRLSERGKSLDDMLRIFSDVGYQPVRLNLELLKACKGGTVDWKTQVMNLLFAPVSATHIA